MGMLGNIMGKILGDIYNGPADNNQLVCYITPMDPWPLSEKVLNPLDHSQLTPNTSSEGTWIHREL